MSDPLLHSLRHTPMTGDVSIEEALTGLATESAHAVAEDLKQLARYGKIQTPPSAVNLVGVRMQDEEWTLAVIVIAYPSARDTGAGDFIKAAFEGTLAEHRRTQQAGRPPDQAGEME